MAAPTGSLKVILFSLIGNFVICLSRLICYTFTKSPSMLAATIHAGGDTINQLLLFIGAKKGQLGPCHRYPMGQGRASYVFNLLASLGIMLGACFTLFHGFQLLLETHTAPIELSLLSIGVLIFSILIETFILYKAAKGVWADKGELSLLAYLQEADDPSILGVLFEDGIAVFGASVALIGIFISYKTQSMLPDIFTTLIIGSLLLVMSFYLFFMNYRLIVGAGLPEREHLKIKEFLKQFQEIDEVVRMKSEVMAPGKVRLSMEIKFNGHHVGDRFQFRRELTKLKKEGLSAAMVVEQRDQAVREISFYISKIEQAVTLHFPDIVLVDTEPN